MRSPKIPWRGWAVLVLTGVAGFLFFLDRNVLAALKTTLGTTLGITNEDYSMLVTAFLAPYILMYFFVGRFIDRWGTRISVSTFVVLMSVAALLSGLARDKWQLSGARALLGIAEAGVQPAIFVAVATWFPPERRAFAFALRAPIQAVGPIVAPVFAAFAALSFGWRSAFWMPAVAGIAITALWWTTDSGDRETARCAPVSIRSVLLDRTLWGIFAARILTDPFWFLLQFWQAGYLQESLGVSLAGVGKLLWLPPLGETLLGLALGWYSDRLIRRGLAPPRARAWILIALVALTPCALVLAAVRHVDVAIAMLVITQFMSHGWLGGTTLLAAEYCPKERMASVVGVMSALGGISSIVVNAAAGLLVDWFGYSILFLLAVAVFPVAAAIVWRCYLRKPAPQRQPEVVEVP